MKRLFLAFVVFGALATLPGCTTDFGVKAGPGYDVNPFALLSGDSPISPANDQRYSNGDPLDCRTHR